VRIGREGDLVRALLDDPGPVSVRLERDGSELEHQGPALSRAEALGLASDLDLRLDVERTVVLVNDGFPAALAGMRDGDRIAQIDRSPVSTWRDVTTMVGAAAAAGRAALFIIDRTAPSGEPDFVTLRARAEARPSLDYGFSWRQPRYVYRTTNLLQAARFGAQSSWRLTEDIWLTLKGMIMQRVPVKSMGGIISIGKISYNEAAAGWVSLFFFLCLLSINLAFINVLPIPVLDGGHLFFLIVEKIKGSPVSDRVLGYSQLIGVVLILSLMVFVTYNDLVRWVFRADGS
jgi:regulator of sigma E protease